MILTQYEARECAKRIARALDIPLDHVPLESVHRRALDLPEPRTAGERESFYAMLLARCGDGRRE